MYVINKADRAGADRVEQEVTAMLSLASRPDGWRPPIVKTVATTGQGTPESTTSPHLQLEIGMGEVGHPGRARKTTCPHEVVTFGSKHGGDADVERVRNLRERREGRQIDALLDCGDVGDRESGSLRDFSQREVELASPGTQPITEAHGQRTCLLGPVVSVRRAHRSAGVTTQRMWAGSAEVTRRRWSG